MNLRIGGSIFTLVGLLAATTQVAAQDRGEDWDFGEDAARDLAIAAVTFDSFGVAVRCLDGKLSLVLSGLPSGSGERRLDYRMNDDAPGSSLWISGRNSTSAFAVWPRWMATRMSEGGRLSVGVPDGERTRRYVADLPPSPEAVGKVFRACGHDLDAPDEDTAPKGENLAGLNWLDMPRIDFPDRARYEGGLAAIACGVRANGRLRDCTIESEFPEGSGFGRAATLGAHRTGKVGPSDGGEADIDGRTITFISRYSMYDAPMPQPPSRLPGRDEAYNPVPEDD